MATTAGLYVPPWKKRALAEEAAKAKEGQDPSDEAPSTNSLSAQKESWAVLQKSINGIINRVNPTNIKQMTALLFTSNLIRGRGLLTKSLLKAQQISPSFTSTYASLLSVINTKLPETGELVLSRLILNFRRSYKRRDKSGALSCTKFVAHFVNQSMAHEVRVCGSCGVTFYSLIFLLTQSPPPAPRPPNPNPPPFLPHLRLRRNRRPIHQRMRLLHPPSLPLRNARHHGALQGDFT